MHFQDSRFDPQHLTITGNHVKTICRRLRMEAGIPNASTRIKRAEFYQNNPNILRDHISGHGFSENTTTRAVRGMAGEQQLVAKKDIPTGTILGCYFGRILIQGAPHNQRQQDRTKKFRVGNMEFAVVGENADGTQNYPATMNDATTQLMLDEHYLFPDERGKNQVCTTNVLGFLIYGEVFGVETNISAFITTQDIKKGTPLLWSYDGDPTVTLERYGKKLGDFFSPPQAPGYHTYSTSRGMIPLLFNKQGGLVDKNQYLPKRYNVRIENQNLSIPYYLVTGFLSQNPSERQDALNRLIKIYRKETNSTFFPGTFSINNIRAALEQTAD